MLSDAARRFSLTPAWSIPRSASRFSKFPPWLGCILFGLVIAILVVRQLTQPQGYYGETTSATITNPSDSSTSKSASSWSPSNWSPSSIFGSSTVEAPTYPMLSPDREIKIIITENMSTHDEVVAPLIAAFGSIPGANITAILLSKMDRFGSFEMFRHLKVDSPNPIPAPTNYRTSDYEFLFKNPPDILVCTTCAYDKFDDYQKLFEKSNTHIFCVIHHSDKWKDYKFNMYEQRLGRWVAADRLDFITLSPHVARAMPEQLLYWKELKDKVVLPPVHVLPPVFAVDLPEINTEGEDEIAFALQGNFNPLRRNFTRAFEELGQAKQRMEATNEEDLESSLRLHMVGSGTRPPVPSDVEDMVIFNEQLNFTDYYKVLSTMTAIVPAFADEDYFTTKASSSVPAALIAGAPIVASRHMLETYAYLEEDAVWLQGENQTDFDVIWDMAQKPRWERSQKMRHARMLGAKLAEANKGLAAGWVNDVLQKRQDRLQWSGKAP